MHSTRIDLPAKARTRMTGVLNARLADALDLQLQAKQAHLEREGPVVHRAARAVRQDRRGDRGSRRRHRGAHHGARRGRRGNRAGSAPAARASMPIRCTSWTAARISTHWPLALAKFGKARAQGDRRGQRRRATPTPATCSPAFRAPQTRTSGWSRRTCRRTADRPPDRAVPGIVPPGLAVSAALLPSRSQPPRGVPRPAERGLQR